MAYPNMGLRMKTIGNSTAQNCPICGLAIGSRHLSLGPSVVEPSSDVVEYVSYLDAGADGDREEIEPTISSAATIALA